jgi:hypothetical protein
MAVERKIRGEALEQRRGGPAGLDGVWDGKDKGKEVCMPFCPDCGREVREEAVFCPRCGRCLREAPATPPSGRGKEDQARVPVPPGGGPRIPAPPPPAVKGGRRWLYPLVGTLILVVAAAAVLCLLLLSRGKGMSLGGIQG